MIRSNEVEYLDAWQRTQIRYHIRATEQGIANKYGISVRTVRLVRATAQPNHPARVAAKARRGTLLGEASLATGTVSRREIPAVAVAPPKGQLHVEGGVDLPQPLS